jgi:N-dimethylarginine dimethylaminohydrolase
MKNRTANLRRLVDKYSIRYGEIDPIVMHLKNELMTLESGQEIIAQDNFKPYPSSRQRLERSKDLESLAS